MRRSRLVFIHPTPRLFHFSRRMIIPCVLLPNSAYATSGGGVYSLVVSSLPVGVLVCVGQAPSLLSHTVLAAENFATLLRH